MNIELTHAAIVIESNLLTTTQNCASVKCSEMQYKLHESIHTEHQFLRPCVDETDEFGNDLQYQIGKSVSVKQLFLLFPTHLQV